MTDGWEIHENKPSIGLLIPIRWYSYVTFLIHNTVVIKSRPRLVIPEYPPNTQVTRLWRKKGVAPRFTLVWMPPLSSHQISVAPKLNQGGFSSPSRTDRREGYIAVLIYCTSSSYCVTYGPDSVPKSRIQPHPPCPSRHLGKVSLKVSCVIVRKSVFFPEGWISASMILCCTPSFSRCHGNAGGPFALLSGGQRAVKSFSFLTR